MVTFNKRTLSAAVVMTALSAPATASAMIDGNPIGQPASGGQRAQLQAYSPAIAQYKRAVAKSSGSVASQPARVVSASAVRQPSSQAGFEWADAGIGAAGALVLVGVSSGAAHARRRRTGALIG